MMKTLRDSSKRILASKDAKTLQVVSRNLSQSSVYIFAKQEATLYLFAIGICYAFSTRLLIN